MKRDLRSISMLAALLAAVVACDGANSTAPGTSLRRKVVTSPPLHDDIAWAPSASERSTYDEDPGSGQAVLSGGLSWHDDSPVGMEKPVGVGGISVDGLNVGVYSRGIMFIDSKAGEDASCHGILSCQFHMTDTPAMDCVATTHEGYVFTTGKVYYKYSDLDPDPLTSRSVPCAQMNQTRQQPVPGDGSGGGSNMQPITITCTWYQDQVSNDGGQTWQNVGAPYSECSL